MRKMQFLLTTNRKFGTIEIERGLLDVDMQILQIFQRHGFNVAKLILCDGCIDNLNGFVELLNLTPNLERVSIISIQSSDMDDMSLDQVLPDLKRMKHLHFNCSDKRIIQCFRKAKLISIDLFGVHCSQHDPLVDFLLAQKMLTSLHVIDMLLEMGKLNVSHPFRLTKLVVANFFERGSSEDNAMLLRFFKSQANSLQEVGLGYDIPSSVYECIFANMPKLNKFKMIGDGIPRDNGFCDRLKENANVRTLKLACGWFDKIHEIENLFKKLPKICSLILPVSYEHSGNATEMTQNLNAPGMVHNFCQS